MNTVISQDGTTVAYAKLGHGPAVILVAGAFCSRTRRSGPELAKLLASRFTVYNYDRRAAARGAIPSPMPSRVRSRISKHSSTKLAGRPTCMAFPLELPLPCTRPYSSARKSRSWLCTSRLYIVGAIRLSGTMHCVHSIREYMNSREENALVGKAAIRACCQRQPQLRKKRDFLPIMFPREYRQHSPLHSEQGKRKKTSPRPERSLGHDRGTDRNRRASNSLSPVLIHFLAPHGQLYHRLLALEQVLGSLPPLVSAQQRPGPREPHHAIPPEAWPNVVCRVREHHEPLRQVAAAYGVSRETVRRLLRTADNESAG